MLQSAGLDVVIRPPGIDESVVVHPDPTERALALARAKAGATHLEPHEIGIAADQVIYDPVRGVCFGKPVDADDHRRRLLDLRGRAHELHTAFVVWSGERFEEGYEVARVTLRADLTEAEIDAYVATGDGSGCAGGYTVEGKGSFLIAGIEGDWFSVVGLPLYRVHTALRSLRRG